MSLHLCGVHSWVHDFEVLSYYRFLNQRGYRCAYKALENCSVYLGKGTKMSRLGTWNTTMGVFFHFRYIKNEMMAIWTTYTRDWFERWTIDHWYRDTVHLGNVIGQVGFPYPITVCYNSLETGLNPQSKSLTCQGGNSTFLAEII